MKFSMMEKFLSGAVLIASVCAGISSCTQSSAPKKEAEPEVVAVESVVLDKTELSLTVDETYQLSATVVPANADDKTIYWSSTVKEIATVKDGLVTAVKKGEAEIKAASTNGKVAVCKVKVSDKATQTPPAGTDETGGTTGGTGDNGGTTGGTGGTDDNGGTTGGTDDNGGNNSDPVPSDAAISVTLPQPQAGVSSVTLAASVSGSNVTVTASGTYSSFSWKLLNGLNGETLSGSGNSVTVDFALKTAGIYSICVEAKDSNNKVHTAYVTVKVN